MIKKNNSNFLFITRPFITFFNKGPRGTGKTNKIAVTRASMTQQYAYCPEYYNNSRGIHAEDCWYLKVIIIYCIVEYYYYDAQTCYLQISADRMSNKNSFGLKYERCTSVERVLHYFNIVFFYIIIIIIICVSFERSPPVTENNNNNNNNIM